MSSSVCRAQMNIEPLNRHAVLDEALLHPALDDELVGAGEGHDGPLRLAADPRPGRRRRGVDDQLLQAVEHASCPAPRSPASTVPSAMVSSTAARGRQRERLAAVGPREEHVLEHRHDVPRPGHRRDGHAVAERLAVAGQVGHDAVALPGAARREPEAGDDLVEDRDRAVPSGRGRRRPAGSPASGVSSPDGSRTTAATVAPVRRPAPRSRSSRSLKANVGRERRAPRRARPRLRVVEPMYQSCQPW